MALTLTTLTGSNLFKAVASHADIDSFNVLKLTLPKDPEKDKAPLKEKTTPLFLL